MFNKYRIFKAMFFIAALASISGTVLLLNIAATQSTKRVPASFFVFMCLICALYWMLKMIQTPTYVHPKDWPINFVTYSKNILKLLNEQSVAITTDFVTQYNSVRNHCSVKFTNGFKLLLVDNFINYTNVKVKEAVKVGSGPNELFYVDYEFEITSDGKASTVKQTWVFVREYIFENKVHKLENGHSVSYLLKLDKIITKD